MAFNDMREFLSMLEEHGQLKQVDIPLNCKRGENELQSLMRHLALIDGPALMLNNLEGFNTPDIPVIFNPFGTRERTAMTLGLTDPVEAKRKHAQVLGNPASWHEPVTVDASEAPCKDVIIRLLYMWWCRSQQRPGDRRAQRRLVSADAVLASGASDRWLLFRGTAEEAAVDLRVLESTDESCWPAPRQGPQARQTAGNCRRLSM
jgi:hypothetical protein